VQQALLNGMTLVHRTLQLINTETKLKEKEMKGNDLRELFSRYLNDAFFANLGNQNTEPERSKQLNKDNKWLKNEAFICPKSGKQHRER